MSTGKKIKKVYLDWISTSDFEGTIDEVIENLKRLKEEHSRYPELKIEDVESYGETSYSLFGYREETDNEYELRLKRNEERKKKLKLI